MESKPTLTAARLRELMRYEPDGTLHWREIVGTKRVRSGPVGAPAGHGGRLQASVDGTAYYIHRLVWLYHHGDWPKNQLDHINGNKLDNRIGNLREASTAENLQNRRPVKGGVTFEKRAGKWRARIMVDGKSTSLGYYVDRADAERAYQDAKQRLHPFYVTGIGRAA